MTEYVRTAGVMDVISMLNRNDTTYVLPTMEHAMQWWRVVRTAVNEIHGDKCVTNTKTACVTKCTHRALRLWTPYERNPENPMDFEHKFKYQCDYVSPYYYPDELRRIAK